MTPTLAPPAGGFKWRDDEYWNKHEGLMTQTWPHRYETRERVKNKSMTINARTLSAAGLQDMSVRPGQRPATVPASLPSAGRRFLDNIDNFMGKNNGAPAQLDSVPSTPGRRGRSTADQRSNSLVELGNGRQRAPAVNDPKSKFKDNMYFFQGGMARAEPLNINEKDRVAYGLVRKAPGTIASYVKAPGPAMKLPMPIGMKGGAVPYTNNQIYGARSAEGERPSSAADKGRKQKTMSDVVMGMTGS